jgi:hypothetical protein
MHREVDAADGRRCLRNAICKGGWRRGHGETEELTSLISTCFLRTKGEADRTTDRTGNSRLLALSCLLSATLVLAMQARHVSG